MKKLLHVCIALVCVGTLSAESGSGLGMDLGVTLGGVYLGGNPSTGEVFATPIMGLQYGFDLGLNYQFSPDFTVGISADVMAGGLSGASLVTWLSADAYCVFGDKNKGFAIGPLLGYDITGWYGVGVIVGAAVFFHDFFLKPAVVIRGTGSIDVLGSLGYSIYLGN